MPNYVNGGAVLILRGGCKFGPKALNAQAIGASLIIIADESDPALQRPGALHPHAGYVGIPSVMVPWTAAKYILSSFNSSSSDGLTKVDGETVLSHATDNLIIDVIPSDDSSGSKDWIDLAYTEFSDSPDLKITQIEGLLEKYTGKHDILAWLKRQRDIAAENLLDDMIKKRESH